MGEDFEKTTKELLKDVKGQTAKTITVMAMNIDNKLDEILEAIRQNKIATDNRIDDVENKVDDKFSKLKVVLFFSEHSYLFWVIVMCIVLILSLDTNNIFSFVRLLK